MDDVQDVVKRLVLGDPGVVDGQEGYPHQPASPSLPRQAQGEDIVALTAVPLCCHAIDPQSERHRLLHGSPELFARPFRVSQPYSVEAILREQVRARSLVFPQSGQDLVGQHHRDLGLPLHCALFVEDSYGGPIQFGPL
eukprot:5714316-Lingulodinium_polyedra.AAC.1